MKATANNIQAVANKVNNTKTRSAWSRGVKAYALDILASFEESRQWCEANGESVPELDEVTALYGADNWQHWAEGASGLSASFDIMCRLCPPSEIKKGVRCINWLEVEARAAHQAWRMIAEAVRKVEA